MVPVFVEELLPVQCLPHLLHPVDPVVGLEQRLNPFIEGDVGDRSG